MAYDLATIVVSGNLLSNDFLHSSKQPGNRLNAFDPGTFNPDWQTPADFDRTLAEAWDDLKDRFDSIQGELLRMDTSTLRNQWLLPVLRTLGFSPVFQKAHTRLKNVVEVYPISHRGWNGPGAPAIHLLGIQEDLDLKPTERGAKSPQMMLQNYLNQDATQHWAVLSNGFVLRLLRDYFHTSQPGYVQFNLYEMFLTREYDEFRSLYRLAHASRFKPRGKVLAPVIMATPAEASEEEDEEGGAIETEVVQEAKELPVWLEVLYEHARSEGSRAEANLRDNVKKALELLGHGLLTPDLREKLADADELETYYRQLLRVVYRSIFLLFAEQRGLIPGAAPHAELYRDEYSLTALRDLSEEQRFVRDTGHDLWERLLLTFELARVGNGALGVQPFNGNLFDRGNIYLITGACHDLSERNRRDDLPRLSNDDTLKFIECLGFTDAGGVKERINYRDLKVEEIGHIYESLLDYAPRIAEQDLQLAQGFIPRGTFFLDMGTERKSTGSYYTPKELVQEVISRALVPVIHDRLAQTEANPRAKEAALLGIRVLDPACGSAAFLIAATDTLAQELADLRWQVKGGATPHANADEIKATFEDEVQRAKRDVLAHCIYGVDYNDMAVELAQVALWINAASAGYPLSFLDHRIKHGNSLVGAPLNFVQLGIDPDAYKGRGDADAETLKEVRKGFSKKQLERHRARMQGQLFDLAVEIPDLDSVEERGAQDVQRKADLYHSFRERDAYKKWQLVADYWTSVVTPRLALLLSGEIGQVSPCSKAYAGCT